MIITILIAIVLAAVAFWICLWLGLPWIVAVIAALLVLLAGWRWSALGARRGAPPV